MDPPGPTRATARERHSFPAVIGIGASAGGVTALQRLARLLPAGLPAPVLVVQHIGPYPSVLPQLLTAAGPLPAQHAVGGETPRPGRVYVAPPDRHMIVEDGVLRCVHGPKEHHTRPAIDPLFRSMALAYGPRAIGVILTGWGEDGTPGLQAVSACGGTVLVQDPAEAQQANMPMSALRYVDVDGTFRIAELPQMLTALLSRVPPELAIARPRLALEEEQAIFMSQGNPMEHLDKVGAPSAYVCPDCNGGLWEVAASRPRRFRCHTGHAFTLRTLQEAQSGATDMAMWNAMRGLEEKEMLLRDVAQQCLEEGASEEAARMQMLAHAVAGHAAALRELIEREAPRAAAAGIG
ncbi:MAG TPA: chemotaxis protein CheB [Usitatibacter sp.]|nr:chemotaxis protein CheB [Usitatibacter sp.]